MTLLWTIFSTGKIHIWRSSEYFGQQDGVCVGLGLDKLQTTWDLLITKKIYYHYSFKTTLSHLTQC